MVPDPPAVELEFSPTAYTVAEGEMVTAVLQRTAGSVNRSVTVNVSSIDDEAGKYHHWKVMWLVPLYLPSLSLPLSLSLSLSPSLPPSFPLLPSLSPPTSFPLSFPVSGSDYTSVSETLTFSPGQSSFNVTVTALNDSEVENNETFTLSVTPDNPGVTLPSATILITDRSEYTDL